MSAWGKSFGTAFGRAWGTIVVTPGGLKVWMGSSWEQKTLKVFNGTVWEVKPLKRFNGTSWVPLG